MGNLARVCGNLRVHQSLPCSRHPTLWCTNNTRARRSDSISSESCFGMLATIFRVHRFVAGGFGLCLLFLPAELYAAMSPGRVLPVEEKLTLQSWAAFMLAVAYIAHAAPSLPLSAQTAVARGLALCFMIETILYGYYAAFGLASSSPEYRVGVICTGSIFAVLWVAYSTALLCASVPEAPKMI